MRRTSIFQSISGFFGLTPEYKYKLYSQIHEIVFHGQGGYSWSDVYNMPVWIRRFTFQKIKEYYDKSQEDSDGWENANKSQQAKILRPGIGPNYSTKTSPK